MPDQPMQQDLPNGLFMVATPIGNLSDMSDRARSILSQSTIVFCEDTRQGAKLFSALGIERGEIRLERLDAHTPGARLQAWAERMAQGGCYSLITDAGTPGVSDPGSQLVRFARTQGVRVVPVPGPSAVMALLSVAGFEETAFAFYGFFPRKAGERLAVLQRVAATDSVRVHLWFESPNRILAALEAVSEACADAEVVVAKELTKIHEKFFAGSASDAFQAVAEELKKEGERGEWCFAVRFSSEVGKKTYSSENSSDWVKTLQCLLDAQVSPSEAARQVSQHFGVPRKEVYESVLKISGKKV